MKGYCASFCLLLAASAAAQTQVPNNFEAGQPARAAEVNQNFAELESGVNRNSVKIEGNSAAIAANVEDITSQSQDIVQNAIAIQENLGAISVLQNGALDKRAKLVDANQVEVGRVVSVSSSSTFTIDASIGGFSGILLWNPNYPHILTIQGPTQGPNLYFDAPCSDSATAITINPFVAAAGLLPIVNGRLYAVDTSIIVPFTINYYLQTGSNGVGCAYQSGTSSQEGYTLIDLGIPWSPPFNVQ